MLSVLYPDIEWDRIETVGLDLDGTVYDEFEFIRQAYWSIVKTHSESKGEDALCRPYAFMLKRWLEKGSSYPHIFSEVHDRHLIHQKLSREQFVQAALKTLHECEPVLRLSGRSKCVLKELAHSRCMFLVSDGQAGLQARKCRSLGLEGFVDRKNMFFTDEFGPEYQKPATGRSVCH